MKLNTWYKSDSLPENLKGKKKVLYLIIVGVDCFPMLVQYDYKKKKFHHNLFPLELFGEIKKWMAIDLDEAPIA